MNNLPTLYIYSKCSTCKETLRFLEKLLDREGFITKEITVTPPNVVELKKMLQFQEGNLKKIFNTSGNLYKEMRLSEKLDKMTLDEALTLLSQHGMLVKRPFFLGQDFGLVGFNENAWRTQLEQSDLKAHY